jgi:hypothetical protein
MITPQGNIVVGKKGRSGRKCYRDEQLRIEVIENAWLKKKKRMTDQDATQIVVKDMAQKIAGADGKNLNISFDPIFNATPPGPKENNSQ